MRKFKISIILGGFIAIIIVLFAAIKITSHPSFCARCHEIAPAVESWRQFSHNKVNCIECHADPGVVGLVKRKIGAYKELYLHFTGTYPNNLEAKVNFENCYLCHSGKQAKEYPNAANIAKGETASVQIHKSIIEDKTSCLNCHREVAHGNLD